MIVIFFWFWIQELIWTNYEELIGSKFELNKVKQNGALEVIGLWSKVPNMDGMISAS